MPRYYFETEDDTFYYQDEDGTELAGPGAARREALSALPDMARDSIPDGNHMVLTSKVLDERGHIIFEGTLTLVGTWYERPPEAKD